MDQQVVPYFTREDGQFLCARWGRPLAPVIFGVDDDTLKVFKGAIEAVVALAGHHMAETDPELGANVMMFFCAEWRELLQVDDLEHLVPELQELVTRLTSQEANQYRIFRVDERGALRAAFVFVRMDAQLQALDAHALALSQAVQIIMLWSDQAFAKVPALEANAQGEAVLREEVAQLIKAAYDPSLPHVARDPSHALRLAARMELMS